MDRQEPQVQQKEMQNPAHGEAYLQAPVHTGANQVESVFAEKNLRGVVDSKLNICPQRATAVKANSLLGYIRKNVASSWGQVVLAH